MKLQKRAFIYHFQFCPLQDLLWLFLNVLKSARGILVTNPRWFQIQSESYPNNPLAAE